MNKTTQEFREGYNQALIDIKLKAIEPLRKFYLDKKRESHSRIMMKFFNNKLYAIKDIEEWINSISNK